MQFLANENIPLPSVRLLRKAGYDTASVTEMSPGIDDTTVLTRAVDEQRIVLTFDRDYGELIYRLKQPSPKGVIYLRFRPHTPEEPAILLLKLFQMKDLQLESWFTVLERDRIRQRPLP